MSGEPEAAAHPSSAPRLRLRHGHDIPRIGLGTWPMVGGECEDAVRTALQMGYRLIDTAFAYGNEQEVGRALRSSGVPREEIFVTSKFNKESHSVEGVRRAYDASLRRLGLEYLDLYLCHWPVPQLDRYVEAWKGLVRLLSEGAVRAIGVSNFKPAHLERIIDATGVVPDVNQIQLSPDVARQEPRRYHERHGIVTESWSPLGRSSGLRDHPTVVRIAAEAGRSPAQIILRWHAENSLVPIPQAADPRWLAENLAIFDFSLSPAQLAELQRLDRGEEAARDSDAPENGH